MDDQGLTPQANDLPGLGFDMDEIVESEAIDDAAVSEKEIASLKASKGWQRIAAQMQNDIDGLRTGSAVNMDQADSLEEIGKKYMIAAALATKLQSYLDMVDNASRATVEYETRKQRTNNKSA